MDFFEKADKDIDDHCAHFEGKVDNNECFKRKFLRCLSCEICSYVWTLRFISDNKNMEQYQDMDGLYQVEQELEAYIEKHREHIIKHRLIDIN